MFKKLIFLICGLFSTLSLAATPNNSVTVVLDWFINPDHAPLLVAEQQGFFRQQGLQVKLVQPADPTDGPKLVAAKKAEITITYQPQLLMQVDQGLPLVRFGTLVDTSLNCLVTLKKSGIQRIEDLKGKKIGYSSGGIDSVMLETMLRGHGLQLKDLTFINVRYDLMQSLLSGKIDGFTGAMRNVEPVELNQAGNPAQVFYPEENGMPPYEELIFITHRDLKNDPRLPKFLTALQQGVNYLVAHPQESWEAVIQQHPELNNPMNKASWFASVKYFSKNPNSLDQKKYATFAEFMHQQGLIGKLPELSTYTVTYKEPTE
jgi:putative hydroxymethylpyrimidine transport system substrate-binding protein